LEKKRKKGKGSWKQLGFPLERGNVFLPVIWGGGDRHECLHEGGDEKKRGSKSKKMRSPSAPDQKGFCGYCPARGKRREKECWEMRFPRLTHVYWEGILQTTKLIPGKVCRCMNPQGGKGGQKKNEGRISGPSLAQKESDKGIFTEQGEGGKQPWDIRAGVPSNGLKSFGKKKRMEKKKKKKKKKNEGFQPEPAWGGKGGERNPVGGKKKLLKA